MDKKNNSLVFLILSALLGAFFIFSAWSKTSPNLQFFEYTISSQLGITKSYSNLLARFFIGLEAALGAMLLISVFGKRKWVIKACLALLIVFSIHLIILWVKRGGDADCGCMGELIPMSSWLSLLKNIVLIGLLIVLLQKTNSEDNKATNFLSIIVSAIIIAVPFVIYPSSTNYHVSLSGIYTDDQPTKPSQELRQGKNIVCLMTLTCPHCRDAAALIQQIHQDNPGFPFYILFPYNPDDSLAMTENLADFQDYTGVRDIPYSFINRETFVDILQSVGEDGIPTMMWLEDSTVIRKMTVQDLQKTKTIQKEMESWLKN